MDKEKYQELYVDLIDVKDSIQDLVSYNNYVETELKDNFEISDKIVEANNYEEYLNKVIDTKEVLVSEIIPDVYSRL